MLTSGDLTPKICFKISPQQEFTFYGRDGQVVGTMNFSRTPAFEGSLDESAHLFFNGVANLWNNEILALRAKLQAAEADQTSALDLVSRIREALGDNGKRMQDELIGYCAQLLRSHKAIEEERDGFWRSRVEAAEAEVARLTSEVREWLCDSCNTIYPGPPQKGVWCVVCPKCGGNTAPTKTIELRKANTRIAELEATNLVLIATKISIHQATEAALEWAAINPWDPDDQLELFEEYIDRGLAALLGEGK